MGAATCPRCGVGKDSDGDGNCVVCCRYSDTEVQELKARVERIDARRLLEQGLRDEMAAAEHALGDAKAKLQRSRRTAAAVRPEWVGHANALVNADASQVDAARQVLEQLRGLMDRLSAAVESVEDGIQD